ncbi:outer membrane beta-barrel protein [Polaribacter sp. Z014]|uniref:outer membrane beta-barrel protein n=1 Tax=Polaribacter sp. Z014 TaxID=2927126 RepID=UPI002021C197|nr:outer membrane beta-barrel protein [Polaribacter sp. Z014]MCL7762971.1 outer membrane beta-barrel protein [Polaribacter sp. Z014]
MFSTKINFKIGALLMFLFCFSISIQGQSSGIKGVITDETNVPLEMVSVALLSPKDNTFLSYTTTDEKGMFLLNDIPQDTIVLQLDLLGFKTFSKKLIYNKELIDLKTIVLKEDIGQLDEIVITAVVPVQIKKDTVSFNADSFKVNFDDNIEGLLNKLPGIELEEGKIVAQGTTVTKIFVDGKEFFGGDPSIVLKNISADAIAKIEVIDKNSDEAELTGVNDGNKEVVINFTLKKSKKNRGFGKVAAGLGLDNRYFSNLNYNQFNSKSQLSVIGKFNNINVTGSNIQGFLQNADGIADDSDDDSEDDFIKPQKSLSGFLKTGVAGINYGKEIKKKESFNVDYFYNLSENRGISNTNRVFFSNKNNFNYKSDNNYFNTSDNHNLNFNYENKSSKTSSLRIKGRFYADNRKSDLTREGLYLDTSDVLVTTNTNISSNSNLKKFGNINLNYYHKLPKEGRSFSTNFNAVINNSQKNNNQNTFIERNLNKTNPSTTNFEILRDEDINSANILVRIKYTEPLGGNHYFNTEASSEILTGTENTNQNRKTIKTTTVEDFINYNYKYSENSFKTKFSHSYNKPTLNVSSGLEFQTLNRSFGEVDKFQFKREELYLNPYLFFQYKPNRGQKFRFTYRKYVKAPRANQTNPFYNDINPYAISTGNPDLKTEKTNSFLLLANVYDFNSSVSFNGKLQYLSATDAIIRNVTIDDDYIRTVSYQNSGKKTRFNALANLTKKVNSLGLRLSLKSKYSYNAANSIVNYELNNVASKDYLTSLLIQNNSKRKVDLKAGATYILNNTSFSIEKDLDRKFTTQKYFGMVDFDISKRLNINTQFDYLVYTDNKFLIRQEIPIWNAAISYSLSAKNNIIKLVLIDLLDRNVDVYRRSTLNYFEETNLQSLGRYVVLSYTYKLNTGNKKPKKHRR